MTIIVNFFGSSGVGKSTLSLELTATLKKLGYNADYVPEYAKELVYQKNYSLLSKPFSIFSTQKERIDLLQILLYFCLPFMEMFMITLMKSLNMLFSMNTINIIILTFLLIEL